MPPITIVPAKSYNFQQLEVLQKWSCKLCPYISARINKQTNKTLIIADAQLNGIEQKCKTNVTCTEVEFEKR